MANNNTKNVFNSFLQKGKNLNNSKPASPVSSKPVKKMNTHNRKLGK